ncbi:adenosine receptor A3-like, partial [Oculina patagonica]
MNHSEDNKEFNDSNKATVTESSIGYFICAVNVPMCLASLFGNAAVLTAIWKTPSLHLPEHLLLASLALTDFAVGLMVQPLFISLKLASLAGWQAFEEAIFSVYPFTVWYLCGVSFLTVTAITADRFLALKLHLRYHVAVTHSRAGLAVAAIWT